METVLIVKKIEGRVGKEYIKENHYSKTCHNGPMCWGLFQNNTLVGVCAFATPCSENVRSSIFGADHKDRVTELHRLHTKDDLPKNTTSWFVTRAIKGLLEYRPNIRAILSFSDTTEGHVGTIYKALNFEHKGSTGKAKFYRDQEGRLRHPRQNGVNVKGEDYGWKPETRSSKNRFLLIVGPDKRERKRWQSIVKI